MKHAWILLWKIEGLICGNLVDLLMGEVGFASKFLSVAITFFIPRSLFLLQVFFICIMGAIFMHFHFFVTHAIWQQKYIILI
jgi:hypothetical protein